VIALAVLLLAADPAADRYLSCAEQAVEAPDTAIEQAGAWRGAGGGALASKCLGLAFTQQGRWAPAATAFEQGAGEAERAGDLAAALQLWIQAGNAWLAGNDGAKARAAFDRALTFGLLGDAARGELYLDRARAAVQSGDNGGARGDIDKALTLVPADPLAWLLSATLARRDGDLARAGKDIAEAQRRSPDDASVALEAGNIAIAAGRTEDARKAWQDARVLQPGSAAADTAAKALAGLDAPQAR